MTGLQQRLLRFIRSELERTGGVAPAFTEMRDHLGLASKSGVHRLLCKLEAQGLIHRDRGRVRNIVLADPDLSHVSDTALLAETARRGLLQVAHA